MITVSLKEYGLLKRGGESAALSCQSIPVAAWDWLLANSTSLQLSGNDKLVELIRPIRKSGELCLQVVNYCGVLELPGNVRVEILPKVTASEDDLPKTRQLLYKMLSRVHNLNLKAFHSSSLQTFKRPLIEILISRFLEDVKHMIKRGIQSDYSRRSKELRFLRGQLRVSDQLRQRPGRSHFFQVDFDEYLPDMAENRLISSALLQVSKWAKSPENQRLCRELLFVFADIPRSTSIQTDFTAWKSDRGMVHYHELKPWCELILNKSTPLSLVGFSKGVSFLFPMEVLFERFVGLSLYRQLSRDLVLKEQASSKYLVQHQGSGLFQLKPDFLVTRGSRAITVLDTKWKLITEKEGSSKDKYELSQTDMYQLFAYGEKYLGGKGEIYLIYPKHEKFQHPLPPFDFSEKLRLWVLPYDLDKECLIYSKGSSELLTFSSEYAAAS